MEHFIALSHPQSVLSFLLFFFFLPLLPVTEPFKIRKPITFRHCHHHHPPTPPPPLLLLHPTVISTSFCISFPAADAKNTIGKNHQVQCERLSLDLGCLIGILLIRHTIRGASWLAGLLAGWRGSEGRLTFSAHALSLGKEKLILDVASIKLTYN